MFGKSKKIMLAGCLLMASAMHAQNAAAAPRFVDRLFFDVGGTVHVPQNFASVIGGFGGLGIDMRDFNISISGKYGTSLAIPAFTANNVGVRFEYKLGVVPNLFRLLPSAYAGVAQVKGSSNSGNAVNISGYWIEIGIGSELFLTQDISFLARPYYAFSKLGAMPDYADISAFGMDIGFRYFFGQNRRLQY